MTASPPSTLGEHALTDVERNIVSDLFILARERSRKCQEAKRALREGSAVVDSDEFGDYLMEVGDVCAAIAAAALALVPILAPLDRSDGNRLELLSTGREKDLERFLRPIFEQAGIADDFTVKQDPRYGSDAADE